MSIDKTALAVAWLQEHEPEMAARLDAKFRHLSMPTSEEVEEMSLERLRARLAALDDVYAAFDADELAAMQRAEQHVV